MYFAKSKAGHDKNEIYYVYAEENDFCILVNGRNRTVEFPKKKRRKHLQPIEHVSDEIKKVLDEAEVLNDTVIRKALSLYQEEH